MRLSDVTELTESPLRVTQENDFYVVMQNEEVVLVGGMRSGSSPAGTTRQKYVVIDVQLFHELGQEKAEVGSVELFVKDGTHTEFTGLVNIEVKKDMRRGGYASKIVRAVAESSPDNLYVADVKKKAVSFWKSVGAEFYTSSGTPISNVSKHRGFVAAVIPKPGSQTDPSDTARNGGKA